MQVSRPLILARTVPVTHITTDMAQKAVSLLLTGSIQEVVERMEDATENEAV
jgi:hypothetical protein